MRRTLLTIALLLTLPSSVLAADMTPGITSWDTTVTAKALTAIPRKRVSYTVESKRVVLIVGVQDILSELWTRGNTKYFIRELDAKIQRRTRVYDNVDVTHIPEVPTNDRLMLSLLRPLIEAGKVAVYRASPSQYETSVTVHDHGTKQGTTILDGSVDFSLPDGLVFASYPYVEKINPTSF